MNKALAELIRISNAVGKDPDLVQGGGGNTSVKTADGKYMYIKASGTALKDMNGRKGWRRLRLDSVLAIINDQFLAGLEAQKREVEVVNRLLLTCDAPAPAAGVGPGEARPSVEAHLHAFLDKCVIHLHPSVIGACVNAKNGKAELEKLFKDDPAPIAPGSRSNRRREQIRSGSTSIGAGPPLWVPYVDPGFTLAKSIAKLVGDYRKRFGRGPALLFLEKHGLIITANNPNIALNLVRKVIKRCDSKLKQRLQLKGKRVKPVNQKVINDTKLCIRKAFFEATGEYAAISHFYDNTIAAFCELKDAKKMLRYKVLTPDELVYSNGPAMWIDKCDCGKIADRLNSQIKKGEKHSVAFLVNGVGLFAAGTKRIAFTIRDVAKSSFFIRANASDLGGIVGLSKAECDFINKWEAEAFRKKIASNSGQGQLQGRIAVVTGAGSGLGRSIAIGLARAGATVMLLDIDKKAIEKTFAAIKDELPDAQTMVVGCDVTNEANVDKAFEALLTNWGGLDILVNAAGIAPAAALVDMPVDKWRQALEVNLTGYFLMARAAARIMIQQEMGGSIVNISSKSGLEASKSNTAYNATKAGEIHMARGWALELGRYGIRVNCLAPGNVFEDSKLWDAEYIKVCARKYGIKPEQVIPYYVSKTALNRRIKGQDIADSVVFLCSDRANTITGQTLVADSGQVMVR